ncbi:hypothetical protein GCM10027418_20690 [Mariniluteicoccus endophyticus]
MSTLRWAAGVPGERIGCRLEVGADGRLHRLAVEQGSEVVRGLGPTGALVDGAYVAPTGLVAQAFDDEVEITGDLRPLRLRVRHNIDRTWQVRVQLTNPTDREVVVDRIAWELTPGADARAVVLAAGATAMLAFCPLPVAGAAPVLGLRLTRGDLVVDDEGLACPRIVLAPGASWSLTLQGEWYASRVALWADLPRWFPETAVDGRDLEDWAVDHPDAAVTGPGDRGGVRRVTVAEARGTTLVDLAVAPDAADEITRTVHAAVDRGHLPDAATAVVAALGQGIGLDTRVGELLDDYAERTPDGPSAMQVCLWARMATLGHCGMLDRALGTAARLRPGPGTGLAAVALWTAAALEGRDHTEIGHRVARLADGEASPLDPATVVELGELSRHTDPRVVAARWELELICHADPGEVFPPRPDAELARAVAVRTLAQDPCTTLVRRLLSRCADRDPLDNVEVIAWLGFGGL